MDAKNWLSNQFGRSWATRCSDRRDNLEVSNVHGAVEAGGLLAMACPEDS